MFGETDSEENNKIVVYHLLAVNATDSDQAVVTYYTITNLHSFTKFNFTACITNTFNTTKGKDHIMFSELTIHIINKSNGLCPYSNLPCSRTHSTVLL